MSLVNKWTNLKKNDECYTPYQWVKYLIRKFEQDNLINKSMTIWCPFDVKESFFVQVLLENGYKVVYSHINDGRDFYEYEPEEYDVIISNPPFYNKANLLKRIKELRNGDQTKWFLLMGNHYANTGSFNELFCSFAKPQILHFKQRMRFVKAFDKDLFFEKENKYPAFATLGLANNFFNKDVCFYKGVNTKGIELD
ncbi:sugar-phosphate nucleotidyltransferase [Mycoplasma sp. NEAQ87857]|uniref:sugar-phosphate nucleotidyltransferase n=1 Tax=Mycoplasma sp. NEAQ87857 TaxID=2683967 RepID=UPI001319670C|nr:sugar-phosphate nucleotidyltransferase [Mycoplasma sp. NEAQ87857]QGZ97269.1 sugar-phosphate nucleotidyltransferase [Mycoplasma sp. NEAQ87857]